MTFRYPAALILSAFLTNVAIAAEDSALQVKTWVESNVPEMMRDAKMPGFAGYRQGARHTVPAARRQPDAADTGGYIVSRR